MPGFSLAWDTKQINGTTKKQKYGVLDVIDETKEWDKSYYVDMIHDYQNFLSKKVRYTIVRPARQYNMTNKEIWDIVKTWKKEALQRNLFTCVSNVVGKEYFTAIFDNLRKKITSDRPKISYKETKDDLFLAFDIFSYTTCCQDEAIELQLFFENLFSTGSSQTILQSTINTLKLDFKYESTRSALQFIYKELQTMMDLKLSQILLATDESHNARSLLARATQQNDFICSPAKDDNLTSLKRLTSSQLKDVSAITNHPPGMYEKHGMQSPSALIPFCSYATELIGPMVPDMTYPICDIFEPIVYEGHMCYRAIIQRTANQTTFQGKESGLMLLIDVNVEKSIGWVQPDHDKLKGEGTRNAFFGQSKSIKKNLAKVHIGTLAKSSGLGPGDYILTSLKEMKGTDNFLAWPEDKRHCSLQKYEECQMRGFKEESMKCGCSPFTLLSMAATTDQVRLLHFIWNEYSFPDLH